MYTIFFLYFSISSIIFFKVNGSNNINAKNHLRKLNLKGERLDRAATLTVRKLPDQNKEDATNTIKEK